MLPIDASSASGIREISHFRDSGYRDLDIEATIRFFEARYVAPLEDRLAIGDCSALDCACGYGWLAVAFVLRGGKSAVAVDLDAPRLRAAKSIASILGVGDRIDFVVGSLEDLPLRDQAVDISISVETLEHLGSRAAGRRAIAELARVAARAVVLTTPNKLFPIVSHDTRLPFVHWLPPPRRRWLSRLAGREESDTGNEFLTPMDLGPLQREFRRVSRCLVFPRFEQYRGHFPFYLPYLGAKEKWKAAPSRGQALYYRSVSFLLGTRSHWVMPSLAGVYLRRGLPEQV